MATVFRADDTRLERDVAIKVIRKDNFSPNALQEVLKRFEREAKALASLSHSHIVKVFDYGEYDGAPYLVMEFVPAGTLKEHTGSPMPWSQAARLLLPIARALAYAHERGFIHRDVKPSNILITDTGDPMLTDFGIAKILEAEGATTLTGTGVGIGTPEYMAPEQGTGQNIDARADVYALGVVFYEMLTGRRPYEADTPMAVMLKHITDPLPRPRQYVPDLPDTVESVLLKALAKQPEDRFANMDAFAQALESLLSGLPEALPAPVSLARHGKARRSGLPQSQVVQPEIKTPRRDAPTASLIQSAPSKPARSPWMWIAVGLLGVVVLGLIIAGGIVIGVAVVDNERHTTPQAIASGETLTAPPQPEEDIPLPTHTLPIIEPTHTARPSDTPSHTSTPLFTPTPASSATFTSIPAAGMTMVSPIDGMVMVYVPEGDFWMGSSGDANAVRDEQPQHKVFLDAFWIDLTEVTNDMYTTFVNATGYRTRAEVRGEANVWNGSSWTVVAGASWQHPRGPSSSLRNLEDYPVVQVSWSDAVAYCEWAGRRLPTEAEWEKAARGTDSRIYPWGDQYPDASLANFGLQAGSARPAGEYPDATSANGVLDMAGNVWEWVQDWYDPSYYAAASHPYNPMGPFSGTGRVIRGGSWTTDAQYLRAAARSSTTPDNVKDNIGFRCVLSP